MRSPLKGNITFTSRLTRWVERLLPFEFEVRKGSGKSTGVADYVINCPLEVEEQTIKAESLWQSWFAVNRVTETAKSTPRKRKIVEMLERYPPVITYHIF